MMHDPHSHFALLALAGASLACAVASCGGGAPMPAAPQASVVQPAACAFTPAAAATRMQMGSAS